MNKISWLIQVTRQVVDFLKDESCNKLNYRFFSWLFILDESDYSSDKQKKNFDDLNFFFKRKDNAVTFAAVACINRKTILFNNQKLF